MIPQNLWITVRDKKNIHPEIIANIKKIKNLNRNYKLYIVDNAGFEEMLKEHKSSWMPYYKALNPNMGAMIGDYIRYVLLYLFGGVYIDAKSFCRLPFEYVIKDDVDKPIFFDFITKHDDEILNYFLIAPAKHEVYEELIESIHDNILYFDTNDWSLHHTKSNVKKFTGCRLLTQLVRRYKNDVVIKNNQWRIRALINKSVTDHRTKLDGLHYSKVMEHLVITE
tara:strand:+ start:297 stop:968 length:672 start_codon:yes stop_codon:yes gene_type:complete